MSNKQCSELCFRGKKRLQESGGQAVEGDYGNIIIPELPKVQNLAVPLGLRAWLSSSLNCLNAKQKWTAVPGGGGSLRTHVLRQGCGQL